MPAHAMSYCQYSGTKSGVYRVIAAQLAGNDALARSVSVQDLREGPTMTTPPVAEIRDRIFDALTPTTFGSTMFVIILIILAAFLYYKWR